MKYCNGCSYFLRKKVVKLLRIMIKVNYFKISKISKFKHELKKSTLL